MKKNELTSILNEILLPIGFKKKGNYWVVNGNEVTKIVNLQKSQSCNSFYINWGYNVNSVILNGVMHIYNRVASEVKSENLRIGELLNENSTHKCNFLGGSDDG